MSVLCEYVIVLHYLYYVDVVVAVETNKHPYPMAAQLCRKQVNASLQTIDQPSIVLWRNVTQWVLRSLSDSWR